PLAPQARAGDACVRRERALSKGCRSRRRWAHDERGRRQGAPPPQGGRVKTALQQFLDKKNEVEKALEGLSGVAQRLGAKSLNDRIGRDLVRKLEEDRFHLVVVGEFNHGKTTFVNALLGRQALPVGVTPTTAVIHHIVYGDEPSAKLVLQNGE